MLIPNKHSGYSPDGGRLYNFGGGGGGGQTTSTVTNTNIPEYARGYVENMLDTTQRQLFTGTPGEGGQFDITGFRPYQSYGGTYDPYGNMTSYDPSAAVAGFTPMQQIAQQGVYNLQMPGQFDAASMYTADAMQRANAAGYNPSQFTAAQVQNQNLGYDRVNAPNLQNLQMQAAGNVGTGSFTQPGSAQSYMSPYMQNVVGIEQREAQRQADIQSTKRGAGFAQAGAFGGSRQAIENAEAARNLATQQGDIQARGQQAAFQQAQQQFNTEQQAQLQAALANQQAQQQAGIQNLGAALQTQGLGAQIGLTAQQLNQAAGMQTGQFNQQQNMQAQLANQQAMLAAQQATEQSRQFGAGYGQQMNAQQLAAAQQLGGLGQQQLTAQQGIYGLQSQYGGQQQQYEQQIINQAMQDYANAQQYPLMQLGTMSNMLRGLPMQASTTNMYQAAPNAITQGIGAIGAYGALNNAFGGGSTTTTTGRKEGGVIHAAKGGIMSYDVGGEIESTLSKMDVDDLKRYAKESSSPSIKQMAARLIQEKSMPVPRMARGGILAFAKSTDENNQSLVDASKSLAKEGGKELGMFPDPTSALQFFGIRPESEFSKRAREIVQERNQKFGKLLDTGVTLEGRPTPSATPAAPPPAAPTAPPPAAPPPAAPPPVPPPQGIAQAAAATAPPRPPVARPPAGPAPAPAVPPTPSAAITPPALSPEDPMFATLRAEATKTPETQKEIFERQKKDQEAIGLGPNKDLADYRSRIMAERANLDDEAKRQKNLRLAEFFASWGSTPGATLVAGMTALKKTIPTLIEDEKERKKVLRETDKLIFDLGQAERLELKGSWDKAGEEKTKLAERGMKLNEVLGRHYDARMQTEAQLAVNALSAQTSRYVADSSAAASGYAARLRLQGDQAHAAASAANAAAARESNNINKAQNAYQLAQNAVAAVDKEFDAAKNSKLYIEAQNKVRDLASSKDPKIKAMADKSQTYIDEVEQDHKNRRKEMLNTLRIAENRLNSISGGAAILPTKSETTSSAGPTTMTRAQVESVAKERNKTVAEVEAAAKAKGITIN